MLAEDGAALGQRETMTGKELAMATWRTFKGATLGAAATAFGLALGPSAAMAANSAIVQPDLSFAVSAWRKTPKAPGFYRVPPAGFPGGEN